METRTTYLISDSNTKLIGTLYSKCSHVTQEATDEFEKIMLDAVGPANLIENLLNLRYLTAEGTHQPGDSMFFLIPTPKPETTSTEDGIWFVRWTGKIWKLFKTEDLPLAA